MRVLVTGGTGFVGRHLMTALDRRGHSGAITSTRSGEEGPERWTLRLPDENRILRVVRESAPAAVVHLAGVTSVAEAEADPRGALEVNVKGTLALLDALDRRDPEGSIRLICVSSAHVYDTGNAPGRDELCFDEGSPLLPRTVYAATKLAAEVAAAVNGQASRRPTIIFRPFNHIGPGQRPAFVVSSFARQLARIEAGLAEPALEVGNLEARRDFCDVRDVVEAYCLAVEGLVPPGIYNLSSGEATSLASVLEHFRRLAKRTFEVRVREDRLRRGEPFALRGDSRKIRAACGWKPRLGLETSIRDALEWWREQENRSKHG